MLGIALPMTLASLSTPLLGLVDTAILGHLEAATYLAAVSAGSSVMSLFFWLFGFLRMGTTGLTAQANGQSQPAQCLQLFIQGGLLGLGIGGLLLVLQKPLLVLAFGWINPSAQSYPLALEYCQIRMLAAPATLATYAIMGWLLGLQKAKSVLAIVLVTNLTNILLDIYFINGLGWNSKGAAYASLSAEYLGFFTSLGVAYPLFRELSANAKRPTAIWQGLSALFTVNRHLFVRTLCLVFTMMFFTAKGAQQGDSILAANTMLLQLLLLVAYIQDGFAHAAETLTGHAIGRKDLQDFYRICFSTTLWGLAIAVTATIIYMGWPSFIIGLLTDLPVVSATARQYWLWLAALPLAGAISFMGDGIFIGTGKTAAMQHSMLFATIAVFLPLWWFTQHWGNHGLWLAYTSFLLARSLSMGGLFYWISIKQRWVE